MQNKAHARRKKTGLVFSNNEHRQSLKELVVVFPRFRDFVHNDDLLTSRAHWNDDLRKVTLKLNFVKYWYCKRAPFVESKPTRRLMKELYADGVSFLCGMLFRRIFRIKAADDWAKKNVKVVEESALRFTRDMHTPF